MVEESEDRDLVARTLAGDTEAFAEVVRRHQRRLRWYVAARLHDPGAADDVVQQAFIALYRQLDRYDPEQPLAAWLTGFALNCCRNEWRRVQRQGELKQRALDVLRARAHLERLAADQDDDREREALRGCLAGLESEERELVQLRFHQDLQLADIGQRLRRSGEAVRLQLFRLRQRLAACVRRQLAVESGS